MNLSPRFAHSALAAALLSPLMADPLEYKAERDIAKDKHLVLIASDHEYRSEETLPALARILAKRHGFDCTVLFGVDDDGFIKAGEPNIKGLEALGSADAMIMFTRFQALPDEQMQHIDDYLKRGGPVMGLRTSTHGFRYDGKSGPYAKYDFQSKVQGYEGGFGEQILGQSWVGHYGKNHVQRTRIKVLPEKASHPILRGVEGVMHVYAGGYNAEPKSDWEVLTMAQPLTTMAADSQPDASNPPMASEWTREYRAENGNKGRVFTSLYGASEDLTDAGYRRMLINATYWLCGLEDQINANSSVDFVGPYRPNTFATGKYAVGIKPSDYAGFESQIPANDHLAQPMPKKNKK
ncbi:ThuA domain-containing protein [Luteolibacter algae]|uniref:ThuA domain-containing protein n=1 Tax=Luteolibacter algae TaxID=454151 RepID=A0ABW5D599_9BACT